MKKKATPDYIVGLLQGICGREVANAEDAIRKANARIVNMNKKLAAFRPFAGPTLNGVLVKKSCAVLAEMTKHCPGLEVESDYYNAVDLEGKHRGKTYEGMIWVTTQGVKGTLYQKGTHVLDVYYGKDLKVKNYQLDALVGGK